MTVNTTASSITAQGNSVATSFPFAFEIDTQAEAVVTLVDTTVSPPTTTVLGPTQYSVTGLGSTAGSVTYPVSGSPITVGQFLTVQRVLPLTQPVSLPNQGGFQAKVVEGSLDATVEMIQQLQTQISRCLQVGVFDPGGNPTVLPIASARALGYAGYDSAGQPTVFAAPSGSTPISTALVPFVSAATLASATALLTYLAPYTGAVGRGIVAKLADTISVADFGAVGDGVTDDTVAIQKAYNAVPAGGGRVVFATLTYLVSSHITITKNNVITDGNNCLIMCSHLTDDIYQLGVAAGNISRLVFRNMQFYASVTKTGGACVRALAALNNTNFENVQFGSLDLTFGGPSKLWNGLDVTVSFNRVFLDEATVCCVANHGVRAAGTVALPAAELYLDHRTIGGTRAVYVGGAAGGVYCNGEISGSVSGVFFDTVIAGVTNREGFILPGSIIDSCRDYALYVGPNSLSILDATGAWFASTGAVVAGNGVGVFFDINAGPTAYCNAVMSGCRFYGNVGTGLVNAGALLSLSGCQINNNAAGVIIESLGAQGSSVVGNTFANNTGVALTFQNSVSDYTADGNQFIANGTNVVAALAWTATAAIRHNLGYQTRNSGSSLIPAGVNPTLVINHGLVLTPLSVTFGPGNAIPVGLLAVTPTTFTVEAFGTVSTGGIGLTWMADLGPNS